jgi:enoyl-CoA hydratase/carnithine racemase
MLQGRLPSNVITELLAGGDPMDATDAFRLGLVNQLISKDAFEADVARFASRFARMSRPVLQLMMRTLRLAAGKTLQTGFAECARLYLEELMPLEDVVEGLEAFAAKRAPIWKHR